MKLSRETVEFLRTKFVARAGKSTIADHLTPSADETVNLGSATRKWDTVYARNVVADYVTGTGGDADMVDGFHAYASPNANSLLALDGTAKFTLTAIPQGHGSGLNADTVDGYEASEFAALAENETITGQWSFSPASVQAPFVLGANAQQQLVIGLRADELNKSVNAGDGMTGGGALTSSVTLHLNTPGTLSVSTSNIASGNHTHAITTSSNPGASASIVCTDSNGYLQLRGLGIGAYPLAANQLRMADGALIGTGTGNPCYIQFDTSGYMNIDAYVRIGTTVQGGPHKLGVYSDGTQLTLYRASGGNFGSFTVDVNGSLTINCTSNIILSPGSHHVNPTTSYTCDLGAYNYKWRTLYCAEIYAETLVAQDVLATIGGRIMVAPTTKLSAAIGSGDTTIQVDHNLLAVNDFIWLEACPNGYPQFEVMQVTGGPTGSGPYSYTVTRNVDGSGANNWEYGDAIVNLGYNAGEGYIDITSTQTIHAQLGPTITIFVRGSTSPWNATKPVVTMGNLDSFLGYGLEYGLALGNDVSLSGPDMQSFMGATLDRTNGLRLFNTSLSLYTSTTKVIDIVNGTNPYIAIGSPIPTGWLSEDGIWVGRHTDATYRFYVGEISSGVLVEGVSWDGSKLNLRGSLVIGPGTGFVATDVILHCPFDGPMPYETDLQINTTGHLGQSAIITGSIVGRPGKFGKAVQGGPTATNLLKNPSFEVNVTDDWGHYNSGTGGSISWASGKYYIGLHGCNITASDAVIYIRSATNVSVANNETVCFQARIYRFSSSPVVAIDIWDQTNSMIRASYTSFTKVAEFELGVVSWTNTTGSTVNVRAEVRNNTGDSSSAFVVDACQLELAEPTPYFDGSFPGCSWSGTAHNSTSSRTIGIMYYDNIVPPKEWTISFWFNPQTLMSEATGYRNLFQWLYDVNNRVLMSYSPPSDWIYLQYSGNGVGTVITYSTEFTRDTWYHCAVTYKNGTVYLYINGVLIGSDSTTNFTNSPTMFYFCGQNGSDVLEDDLMIAKRCYSEDEIYQIFATDGPIQVMTNKFELMLTGNGVGKVWGHAGGLFGQALDGTATFALFNEDYAGTWGGFSNPGQGDVIYGHNKSGSSAIKWDKSTGKWGFFGGGLSTPTIEITTSGALVTGTGDVVLNENGLTFTWTTDIEPRNEIDWYHDSQPLGSIQVKEYTGSTVSGTWLVTETPSTDACEINLYASAAVYSAQINVFANDVNGLITFFVHGSSYNGQVLQIDQTGLWVGHGAIDMADKKINGGQFEQRTFTLNDDQATSFTPRSATGCIIVYRASGAAGMWGMANYRSTATPFCDKMFGATYFAVTTGILSGMTGTDGNFTVSAHTDGKIYFENRRGSSCTFYITMLGYCS